MMVKSCLSRLLGEHKMSRAELSRQTGIRPNTIGELYHGSAERISFDHIDRICEVLGCSISDLMVREANVLRKTGNNLMLDPHKRRKRR